jgi:hypothetical protein
MFSIGIMLVLWQKLATKPALRLETMAWDKSIQFPYAVYLYAGVWLNAYFNLARIKESVLWVVKQVHQWGLTFLSSSFVLWSMPFHSRRYLLTYFILIF